MAAITQAVRAFAHYTEPYDQYSALYAICERDVFMYDFANNKFKAGSIYNFGAGNFPYAVVPWYNKVYVTKKNAGLVRLQSNVASLVTDAPGGRYMISANSHLMVGNVSSKSIAQPNRVQWSDLYAPESFAISSSSEADYFELDPDQGEITGLTAQRSNQNIYTANSIVRGQYNPLPTGFRFGTLYSDIGNVIHGAVVQVKDRDFFFGKDNIYALDGTQLEQIGDPVFDYFTETNLGTSSRSVIIALVSYKKNEVMWIYDHTDGKKWAIVYNYKEDKWSDRDPQGILAGLQLIHPLRGFVVIDSISTLIDNVSDLIDGDWQFPESTQQNFYGTTNGQILIESGKYGKFDGTPFKCYAETHEIFADSLLTVKEFDRLKILYSGKGLPKLEVLIGRRKNRFAEIEWSTPMKISEQIPGETTFFIRKDAVGHLIRFAIRWDNTNTDFIDELTHISFVKAENQPDVEQ